jgi:ribosomal protein L11 methyltransferase
VFELQINHCTDQQAEAVSTVLEETGALSITMHDQEDNPILEPALGTSPLWPQVVVIALYEEEIEAKLAQHTIQNDFSQLTHSIVMVPDQDWIITCQKEIKPMIFAKRLCVCPSWLSPPDQTLPTLILDPGLAFGTGTHPTTSLCLEWLALNSMSGLHLIDYGCGSGILSLAALKLGAELVYAVDIDDQALLATQNNAQLNHIALSKLVVSKPEHLEKSADLIIANILLGPLIELRDTLHLHIIENGRLVTSGILSTQVVELEKAYQDYFTLVDARHLEEWAVVEWMKVGPFV